jgi:FADH2 O2-dependent halogenase
MTQAGTKQDRKAGYDVAILGAGISGSVLAAVLARNGVKVLLVDAATHPRFAVGESTIPHTSAMTRIIAERYQVPEIMALASFRGIRDKVSRNCGRKQNFGFVYHREGTAQNSAEINQFMIPAVLRTETHLFRQDTDAYMYNVAIKYGADGRIPLRISDVDITEDGVVLESERGEKFHAEYLVDAGGFRSPLAEKLSLRDDPARARTHTRTLFTHMIGVTPFDDAPAARGHKQPNPWHHGTLHHVFDGGWLWVIPFDNHPGSLNPLCSVGLTLDPRRYPQDGTPGQIEFDAFLARFPEIAVQFSEARAVRPWVSTGRLQYSSKQMVGDRFCLTSHAAGFIDALYSRGLINTFDLVNSLAWRLIAAARSGDWSLERFQYIEDLQQGLFDYHDDLVYSSFVGFGDYELWNAVNRCWGAGTVLGAMRLEQAYFSYLRTRDDGVFRELEESPAPGTPCPLSTDFTALAPAVRRLCQEVEGGSLAPAAAANRIFARLQSSDYLPPSFGLDDPDSHFFHPTPPRMARAVKWSHSKAQPEVGAMIRGAIGGFVRHRVRGN